MGIEIFLVAVVLAVAVLMVVDVARTPGESPHGQLFDTAPAIAGAPAGATAPLREPARPEAPSAAREASQARRPESNRTPAAGRQDSRPGPWAVRPRSSLALKNWGVRSRLWLLAGLPAVAVAVAAACVVHVVGIAGGASIHAPASSVRDGAIASAIAFAAAALVVLALGAWSVIVAAGSVLRPLGTLRGAALELPDAVRRIGQGNGRGRPPVVRPIDVDSSDELGEIARAFDQMRRETLRLAGNEAAARSRLNTMFLNLSHRSQSLVERQIRLVESLEQTEQDPGRLASLSQMDRVVARMYRSSQNLLIMAGRELSDSWNQPVALANLVKAAVSEIDDSERVSLSGQPDIAVRGRAVNDVVHLLAELTENAASFSAGDMPVDVSSEALTTGGALITISDRGIGMPANEMAYANWQLENAQAGELNVPVWMGLTVVARLAARHGIRVRLHAAEFGGLTALVWLPDDILTHKGAASSPGPGVPAASGSDSGASGSVAEPAATATEFAPPREELLGAPVGAEVWPLSSPPPGSAAPASQRTNSAERAVIVPPAEGRADTDTRRLPIYDEVESRWFGDSRLAPGGSAPSGLPRRMPTANPIPGAAPGTQPSTMPSRSAAQARDRLARFQQGVSEGRAAAGGAAHQGQDDQGLVSS